MQVTEQALGGEHRSVLGQALAVHDQVLPVHVHAHVVEPLGAQLVDDVQRHADVAHEDLHGGLGVLVLEEEQDAVVAAALGRHPETVEEPRPALGIRVWKG